MGFDIVHYNLHKTFSQPHGGGGPGGGPVAVRDTIEPYLPAPVVVRDGDAFRLDHDRPKSIGRVRGFAGPFGVFVRSYAFMRAYGPDLREMSEVAVLNANYLLARLRDAYDLPYDRHCMHEFVLSARNLEREHGITALDVAKRLMDYGIHPPTVYFPLVVPEALMIEPTETEPKERLDDFVDAMQAIAREAAESPEAAEGGAARPSGAPPRRGARGEAAGAPLPLRRASCARHITRSTVHDLDARAARGIDSLGAMGSLARLVIRLRWLVIGVWIVLTMVGMFSAVEALRPLVPVVLDSRLLGVRGEPAHPEGVRLRRAGAARDRVHVGRRRAKGSGDQGRDRRDRGGRPRLARRLLVRDTERHVPLARPTHDGGDDLPAGNATFTSVPPIEEARAALRRATPDGVTSHLTGRDPIFQSQGGDTGPGVLTETLFGAAGALLVLLFVFGTLPAIGVPLAMAAASILTTFLCVYLLTYVTDVSIIVQFLVALVGLGVSIDYALLMIFRFREELAAGRRPRTPSSRR